MVSPDGSVIYGGTDPTQSPPTSSLITQYGVWTFGDVWAGPGPDGNCYKIPLLNGRQILNPGGVENQMMVFRQMQVNDEGNLWD
jgi:hypothetical protein